MGGRIVKNLDRKVDMRGEYRDRHGKYIDGVDRGSMKKHLEENRKKLIEERDSQMSRASREKRDWSAIEPSIKERLLGQRARHKALLALLGAGINGSDIDETDKVPVSP